MKDFYHSAIFYKITYFSLSSELCTLTQHVKEFDGIELLHTLKFNFYSLYYNQQILLEMNY